MQRFFTATYGPSDWRRLLADPSRQWRATKSAYELAVAWEAARHTERGVPPEVCAVLDTIEDFRGARLLAGFPEHQVTLEGGGHASQTDLWALVDAPVGVTSVAIEAKAGEGFDKLVPDWLAGVPSKSGKPARLRQFCDILCIEEGQAHTCRYQLLHRTVAAILEAHRFRLQRALLFIQSFIPDPEAFNDYAVFAQQLGAAIQENTVTLVGTRSGVDLYLGWLTSQPTDDRRLRDAL